MAKKENPFAKKSGNGKSKDKGESGTAYLNMKACLKGEKKKNPKAAMPSLMKKCSNMVDTGNEE